MIAIHERKVTEDNNLMILNIVQKELMHQHVNIYKIMNCCTFDIGFAEPVSTL